MKALRFTGTGGPQEVQLGEVEAPQPGPDEVLVRVRAAGLNRVDLLQSQGRYPAPPGAPPDVPGLEYAGEVAQVGRRATLHAPGDRVLGLVGGGACAEYLVAHEREVMRLPAGLSFEQGAAIPEAFITAWDALEQAGGPRPYQAVLVTAVASGVGLAAAQLVAWRGARALGTARQPEKLERLAALGVAVEGLVTGSPPTFAAAVRQATGGRGADAVVELVGGRSLPESLLASAPGGTVVLVGLLDGSQAQVPLDAVLTRRLTLRGTALRSRPLEEKVRLARRFEVEVLPALASGALRAVVDAVLPMADGAQGLERLRRNEALGKLVLSW